MLILLYCQSVPNWSEIENRITKRDKREPLKTRDPLHYLESLDHQEACPQQEGSRQTSEDCEAECWLMRDREG